MKHFELGFTKKLLLISLFIPVLAIIFLTLGIQKVAALSSATNIPSSYVSIGKPHGIAILPDGNIWYVDNQNTRLVLINPTTREILRTVGRLGSAEGEFDSGIYSMAIDNNDYLYVLSSYCNVYKLDPNGGFMQKYNLTLISGNNCNDPHGITYDAHTNTILISNKGSNMIDRYSMSFSYISDFGGYGSADGLFDSIWGLTTDSNGRIYVADEYNERVQVFSEGYDYLFQMVTWENVGGTTSFEAVKDVLILDDGTITVTSQNGNHVIEQFNSSGTHLRTWGGGAEYGLVSPEYLVKDSSNNIYVNDWGLGINAINKFDSTGTYISTFRNSLNDLGKFSNPTDIAYDSTGNLYVTDFGGGSSRVQKFSNSGTFIKKIINNGAIGNAAYHMAFDSSNRLFISSETMVQVYEDLGDTYWSQVASIANGVGTDNGQLNNARGMYFDPAGNLYVADLYNHRVQKFDTNLNYVSQFGNATLTNTNAVVIDSNGHFFVCDEASLQEFDENGTYVRNIGGGDFANAKVVGIDTTNDNIYLSDSWGHKVLVYDHITGAKLSTIGSFGSGTLQFYEPTGSKLNPVTHTMTIADPGDSRVMSLSVGYRILNLIPSANVIIRAAVGEESSAMAGHIGESLSEQAWDPVTEDLTNIPARLIFGDYIVADFTVNLSTDDRDWSTVNVLSLPYDSMALIVNLNTIDAPGISATHSLYVYKYSNQTSVTICPDATVLADLTASCVTEDDGFTLTEGGSYNGISLSAVNIDSKNYWKIDGLIGTGAFSTLFETGFTLSDVMTRQKISTASNHEITFGTTYNVNHIGDTITLGFSSDWDIVGDLAVGNLSLYDWTDARDIPLSSTASDNTWTVSFTTNPSEIVFTAPQNADVSSNVILAGKVIKVFINNNVLINPSSVDSYEISMRILTDDGVDQYSESGSVSIPIVDSDTVNIDGYVLSNLLFDLDTGTGEIPTWPTGQDGEVVDCDASGDDACLIYADGPGGGNYTVDLGILMMTEANKSGGSATHADGVGTINSIYFDLSTNSASGVVLTYKSLYGELRGPGHNDNPSEDYDIPSTDGSNVVGGVKSYGIQLAYDPVYKTIGPGVASVECGNSEETYCVMEQTAEPLYIVPVPIELARGKIDVAAAIDGTVVPGSYTDRVSFVATTIF